jgi:transcriptional regulator with XRE-family HTH domain
VRYEFDRPETIGTFMARVRGERGISQLRLAEHLCVSAGLDTVTRHEVSRWEREERIPSGFWLAWLAVVLQVPLDELERAAAAARRRRRGGLNVPPNWTEHAAGIYVRVA